MPKAHATLKAAIMNGMTPAQQKELADMITEFATATKEYGADLHTNDPRLQASLSRANNAWSALGHIGLDTRF